MMLKLSYQSTVEDSTELLCRMAEITGLRRNHFWFGFIWPPIFLACFYNQSLIERRPAINMAVLIVAPLILVAHILTYRQNIRTAMRKAVLKSRGTDQPLLCEYELSESRLACRLNGVEVVFNPATVAVIRLTDGYLEIRVKPDGISIIPERAFGDGQLAEWVKFLEERSGAKLSKT